MDYKSIFIDEANDIANLYPTLSFELRNEIPVIYGNLDIYNNQRLIDNYNIEVHYKDGYPYCFPLVYETGGKIPINSDWHVFVPNGNCCIKAFPEEILICKKKITLKDFIEEQVMPYLSHQTFRRENGFFLQERSHGINGWIEFFQEILKTNNIANIIYTLEFIQKRNKPDRVSKCFCGSDKKYRKCHKSSFEVLSNFSNNDLEYFISELKKSSRYSIAYKNLKTINQLK